jgi:hypothetical protein
MDYNPLTSVEVKGTVDTRMCQPVHRAWCIYTFGIIAVVCVGLWLFFTRLV